MQVLCISEYFYDNLIDIHYLLYIVRDRDSCTRKYILPLLNKIFFFIKYFLCYVLKKYIRWNDSYQKLVRNEYI